MPPYLQSAVPCHVCDIHVQPIPLGVTFSKAQNSKLERLFCRNSVKRDVRALSFELWNSVRKCHPRWDWLYHMMHFLSLYTIRCPVFRDTFFRSLFTRSLFTETWQKRPMRFVLCTIWCLISIYHIMSRV